MNIHLLCYRRTNDTTGKYIQAKAKEDVAVESHDGTILDSWKIYT